MHEDPRNTWKLSTGEVYPRHSNSGFRVAPDGQSITFVQRRDTRVETVIEQGQNKLKEVALADLCLISIFGGYPRPLTTSGDIRGPAVWSPDGKWLAVERATDGPESLLQILPPGGGPARTVFRGRIHHPRLGPGDSRIGCTRWSPDGHYLLFATRESSTSSLRLVGVDGRLQRTLQSLDGFPIGWDWSSDGRHVLLTTTRQDGRLGEVRLVDVEEHKARVLWVEETLDRKPVAIWTPDGKQILLRSNRSGWAKLWLAAPDGEPQPLTRGNWDDHAFHLSADESRVVYASRAEQDGSGNDLWIVALSGGRAERLTRHSGVNAPLAWTPDDEVVYGHSGPVEPGDVWICSAHGGEPRRLTWSAPIELERKLCAPKEVVVQGDDGTSVPTLVYLPVFHRDGERHPAVVWIRGGPTGICRYDFSPFHNWLANQGFVVLAPNYRGSVGYGVAHMEAVAGEGLGVNDLNDVLAAGRYARTLPFVDLARGVGVGGHSWGGYLALMAVTQAPGFYSCAVAGSAISDWRTQQSHTMVRYYDRWLVGGWAYEQPDRARERSPVSHVGQISEPLLVFHGDQDRDVPYAQIERFVGEARQAGVDIEFITYRDEEHDNKRPENQQDTLNRIGAFFRKHLQPWNLTATPAPIRCNTEAAPMLAADQARAL